MKKYILSLFTLLIIFTACDDYLNVESPSSFDTDYVFSNANDAKKALMASYSCFGDDRFTSRMSNVWQQNTDVETMQPSANPDGSRRDVWSLESYNLTGFSDIYLGWNHSYLAIDRANQCIEGIQASAVADSREMQQLLGEAYSLRAFWYYFLINYWGDVPYFTESAKAGMELDIPRTDKNIIYTGCIQDLVDIEDKMYFADEFGAGIEQMNREFAMGMIARLALFRAGYAMTEDGTMKRAEDYLNVSDEDLTVTYTDINGSTQSASTSQDYFKLASNYCQKLINLKDRELNPDFGNIFRNECEYIKPVNDDVLYEVAFLAGYGGDVGWCVGTTVSPSSFGSTTIQVNLNPAYYFSFDDKDKRRDVTISKVYYQKNSENEAYGDNNQYVSSITGLSSGKWNRLWLPSSPGESSSKGTGINWPLMRYSDVLLMLAEAENELNGPNALATNALKRVRERAFNSEDYPEKVNQYIAEHASKDAFRDAVIDERAWEFGGECLRKFDLVRWNVYGEKIVESKNTITNIGKAAREIELENPEVAQYAPLAKQLYYQKVNGNIIFLNDKYNPDEIPETIVDVEELDAEGNENAYASKNWAKDLYLEIIADDGSVSYDESDYVKRCWRGYKDETGNAPVPYLLPLSTTTVGASDYLTNNGYNLGL